MRTRKQDYTIPVVVFFLVAAAAVTYLHNRAERAGRVDAITTLLRRFVVAPSVIGESRFVSWNEASFMGIFQSHRLSDENARLRAKLAWMKLANQNLIEQAGQAAKLRHMLGLADPAQWKIRAATVIALKPSPARDSALVSTERGDISQKDVVVSPDGALVGQIVQVTGKVGDALLLTDPQSSVGAVVQPVNRAAPPKAIVGICQGTRGPLLAMVDLPGDADIRVGDRVVTSGLGAIYPPGILIGFVTGVRVDRSRGLTFADVDPVVDCNRLQEVLLRQ